MFALPLLLRTVVCAAIVYPEQRSDLQRYQDTARCYPDVGEWYLMFRNYYVDADFGGAEECVKFRTFETYSSENYTAYVEFVIGNEGSMQHSGGYENALEPTKSADDRSPMGLVQSFVILMLQMCYPDPGLWYLMYRNYEYDPNFGGAAKCVRYHTTGSYESFSSHVVFFYGDNGTVPGQGYLASSPGYETKNIGIFQPDNHSLPVEVYNFVYVDCGICTIKRHPYANNGRGCTQWRKADTLHLPADCCDFIYDLTCGTSPKYKLFDETCPL
ncbi:hypothetical protein MTO96_014742 [Rhipicephalus appendiculatus]